MIKRVLLVAAVFPLLYLSVHATQDNPIMDKLANRVIQKYQRASCEDLSKQKAEHGQTRSPQEDHVIEILRNDARMREAFINKVAPPIANKMFECGMIP